MIIAAGDWGKKSNASEGPVDETWTQFLAHSHAYQRIMYLLSSTHETFEDSPVIVHTLGRSNTTDSDEYGTIDGLRVQAIIQRTPSLF